MILLINYAFKKAHHAVCSPCGGRVQVGEDGELPDVAAPGDPGPVEIPNK